MPESLPSPAPQDLFVMSLRNEMDGGKTDTVINLQGVDKKWMLSINVLMNVKEMYNSLF